MATRPLTWVAKRTSVLVFLCQMALSAHLTCESPRPVARPRAFGSFNYSHSIRTSKTNSTAVQRLFNQGMVLAAGYNQEEALNAFITAVQYDKYCAMCWWGVAYARAPFQNKPAMQPPSNSVDADAYARYSQADMAGAVRAITYAAALVGLIQLEDANSTAEATAALLRARHQPPASPGSAWPPPRPPPPNFPPASPGPTSPPRPPATFRRLFKRLRPCWAPAAKSPPAQGSGRRRLTGEAVDDAESPPNFPPDFPVPPQPNQPSTPSMPYPPPQPFSFPALSLERHYIAAMADRLSVRALYGQEWEWAERRYARDMMKVAACVPTDADAPALAAEALANLTPWDFVDPQTGAPRETTPLVLEMINTALERNPLQPLALHLHIHVTEGMAAGRGDNSSGLAEASADKLMNLLPSLDHMQHMPSHNYVRVGRWGDAVLSNIASLRASVNGSRACLASVYPEHSAAMLVYAASMGAERETADLYSRVLRELPRFITDATASLGAQWVAPLMVRVRFAEWSRIRTSPPPPVIDDSRLLALLPAWPPANWTEGPDPDSVTDVVKVQGLDPVLAVDPGPARGPLGASEYSQDGAEFAVAAWFFARLMAFAADLDEARAVAGISMTRMSPPPPPERAPPPSPGKSETEGLAEQLIKDAANGESAFTSAEVAAVEAARKLAEETLEALRKAEALVPEDVPVPPGQGLGGAPGYKLMSTVLRLMAEARFALLEANVTAAEALLREAIKVEDGGGYTEPPRLGSQPVRQCLGAVILHHGRIGEALKMYLDDLERYPDNPWSIRGLSDAVDETKNYMKHDHPPAEVAQLQVLVTKAQKVVDAAVAANLAAQRATAVSCPSFISPPRQG